MTNIKSSGEESISTSPCSVGDWDSFYHQYPDQTDTDESCAGVSIIGQFDETLVHRSQSSLAIKEEGDLNKTLTASGYSEGSQISDCSGESDSEALDMATEQVVRQYYFAIEDGITYAKDEINGFVLEGHTNQFLKNKAAEAEAKKKALSDAIVALGLYDKENFPTTKKKAAETAKSTLVNFLKEVDKIFFKVGNEASQQERDTKAIAARVKAARVAERKDDLVGEVQDALMNLENIANIEPKSDVEVGLMEEKYERASKRCTRLCKELAALSADAIAANAEADALELDKRDRELQEQMNVTEATVISIQEKFGIITSSTKRNRVTVIPPPVFTPDKHSGENNDYYDFVSRFDQYKNTQTLTKNEELLVLKETCLTGTLKSACKNFNTKDEVLMYLKQLYGNPRKLLNGAIEEIRKLGDCPFPYAKRRDWIITIIAKLKYLQTLSRKFNMDEYLYPSPICLKVKRSLPRNVQDKMRNELMDSTDEFGQVPGKVMFETLIITLDDLLQETTFELNFNSGIDDDDKEKKTSKSTRGYQTQHDANSTSTDPAKSNRRQKGSGRGGSGGSALSSGSSASGGAAPAEIKCQFCKSSHTHLYYCEVYQSATLGRRFKLTAQAKTCYRCLRSDSKFDPSDIENWMEQHKEECITKFACEQERCATAKFQRHITMCKFHVSKNRSLEKKFIDSLNPKMLPPGVKFFFCSQMYHTRPERNDVDLEEDDCEPDVNQPGIFMLQTIAADSGKVLTLFYDSGCGGAAISYRGHEILNSKMIRPGPTTLQVASGGTVELPGGDDSWTLDLVQRPGSKKRAAFSGVRMPDITSEFPVFQLTKAYNDLTLEYKKAGGNKDLPKIDKRVGGYKVDVMIGIRYRRHYPVLVFELPSGLGIYEAKIKSASGFQGVLGGPHESWIYAHSASMMMGPEMFLTAEIRAYRVVSRCLTETIGCAAEEEYTPGVAQSSGDEVNTKCKFKHCMNHQTEDGWKIPEDWKVENTEYSNLLEDKTFVDAEELGTVAEYRCVACRNCPNCKRGELLESVSLKEELEQAMIEKSVVYNEDEKILEVTLPFTQDPESALKPNRHVAHKVLQTQLKLVEKFPEMKEDVLASHSKLVESGHVMEIRRLPAPVRKTVELGSGYFLPWRVVHKSNSLSTPCRLVFDASSRTPGGESLNGILPKGQNKLIKIQHLLMQFRSKLCAFSFDVKMAYNNLKLKPEYYRYQKYLWVESLDARENPVQEMVIKTAIYGVKPSGSQCQEGFYKIGQYAVDHCQSLDDAADVLQRKMYVDDGIGVTDSKEECELLAAKVHEILKLANMTVKDFTFSGRKPTERVSADGKTVGLLGYCWEPEVDFIYIDSKMLFFGKVRRGLKPEPVTGDVGEALKKCFTRRTILSKVAGVFDPLGLVTPITAKFKLDLHYLFSQTSGWDEPVPEKLLPLWVENLETIQKISEIPFRRSIIPVDAADDKVELMCSVDASVNVAIAVVHSRVRLKTGGFHVQLVGAKSKVISGTTVPKSELKAAVLGSVFMHVVKANIPNYTNVMYLTDSTITLHWIHQDSRPMQTMVRNSVIEIRRFSDPSQWYHVDSNNNIADLGTRTARLEEILPESDWQNGKPWMKLEYSKMPVRRVEDVTLTPDEKVEAATEFKAKDVCGHLLTMQLKGKVAERYSFSKYIVDPCARSWPTSVRILAIVIKFVETLKSRVLTRKLANHQDQLCQTLLPSGTDRKSLQLSDEDIKKAEVYYFKKATLEVLHFAKKNEYKEKTVNNDGILVYKGRILEGQELTDIEQVMQDVSPCMFVRPVIERYSPLAYSIMIYAHSKLVHHRNISTTLLESRTIAFILSGRDLAIEVRETCVHCRRFKLRLVKAEMGKIHDVRLTIAPVFYFCQIDLCGPFTAACEHNHRSTVKVYGVIFKCPATCAVSAGVMQAYDTPAFLQSYIRFSTKFGHPKKIFIDEGSQLMKACREMELNWADIQHTINSRYSVGIEYETSAVGAHFATGQVERSIKEIKRLFRETYGGLKLDIMSYETAFAWVCNELNNLPVCLGSRYENIDHLDLITPARLMFGRNNRRSPVGMSMVSGHSRLLNQLEAVYEAWWNVWRKEKLVEFIPQPSKWTNTDLQVPTVGDIVVFNKDENEKRIGTPIWRLGRIKEVEISKDDVVRVVLIEYQNPDEKVKRTTRRSIRKIAIVHHEGDLNLIDELNQAAKDANIHFILQSK